VACSVVATVAASARSAGTAFSAAVPLGSPAVSPVSNWIVVPAESTYCAVARYSWYAPAHWVGVTLPANAVGTAGAVAGSVPAPSTACSAVYSAGVNPVPPTGFSGPVTPVNSGLCSSCVVAAATTAGSSQTGTDNL
jgi:hypothetical protein